MQRGILAWVGLLIRLSLVLALAGALLAGPAAPQGDRFLSALSGRWNLALETPQGFYQTPVEFIVRKDGKVTATVLGPTGTFAISEAEGTLRGDRVRLSARSTFGSLRVDAKLVGNELRGRWSPASFLSRLFFRGALRGTRDSNHVPVPHAQSYEQVWDLLERHFYALDYKGVDIAALRERFRPQIAASRSDGEFLALMRKMLGEFRTSHLGLFATPVAPSPDPQEASRAAAASTQGISWRQLSPTIGYLRIDSFEDGAAVIERLDRAFTQLRRSDGLIIDVRENGGGSLSAAMRLGDHIFAELRSVGYFVSRDGLVRRGVASIDQVDATKLPVFSGYTSGELAREMSSSGAVMLTTGGRAPAGRVPQPIGNRIVMLVDEYCFSACEALASVTKETAAATLVGRCTAGAMLAAFPLQIDGGWTLLVPVWDFRTPKGVRVEGQGVEPHVAVRRRGSGDADLAAALKHLSK
jgi:carboxyl-terminal processing protease